MAALTKNTPQTYRSIATEETEFLTANAVLYEGAAVIEGAAASSVAVHTTQTTGFAGFVMSPATAAGEVIPVRTRGQIVTPINATVAVGAEGTTVYVHGTNPADIDVTATAGASIGKIARVLTAGSAGSNLVAIAFEADGLRSI